MKAEGFELSNIDIDASIRIRHGCGVGHGTPFEIRYGGMTAMYCLFYVNLSKFFLNNFYKYF